MPKTGDTNSSWQTTAGGCLSS
ncbi:LPXTG cell wall anchor domain-containing protein [Vibrio cincinnatiensis]